MKYTFQRLHALLLLSSISLLLCSACSVNPNPSEAGLIDSLYYLSKNTYQRQQKNKQTTLAQLKQQQQSKKQQLSLLHQTLIKNQELLKELAKELKSINKKQQKEQQSLVTIQTQYAAKKIQHAKLLQQKKRLKKGIQQENEQKKQQRQNIRLLQKKRDALRQEIFLQTTL